MQKYSELEIMQINCAISVTFTAKEIIDILVLYWRLEKAIPVFFQLHIC